MGNANILFFSIWYFIVFYEQIPPTLSSLQNHSENSLESPPADQYNECSNTRGCFGIPESCIETKNCEILVSYQMKDSGDVAFKLEGAADTFQYLALGLSKNDGLMGDDSVMFCYNAGHEIYTGMGWSFENPQSSKKLDDPLYGLKNVASTHLNGILSCTFTRLKITDIIVPGTSKSVSFDLASPYFLQIAKGSIDISRNSDTSIELQNVKLRYHRQRGASSQAIYFKNYISIQNDDNTYFVLAHGCLMVLSWMFLASVGSLTARYCKTHFQESWVPIPTQIYGKDWWFRMHQICMCLTWLFTLISTLIIFISKGLRPLQFHRISSNPHAIVGLVAVTLAFIQPILAYFRPSASSDKRPLFNRVHSTIGYLAIVLSNGAIFLSTYLGAAKLGAGTGIVSSLFVLFLIQSHLIMTVASDKKLAFGFLFSVLGYNAYTITFLVMLFVDST